MNLNELTRNTGITRPMARAAAAAGLLGALTLSGAAIASAEPTPAECANGKPCASAPGCPDRAVTLPAGPHAEGSAAGAAGTCSVTTTVAPRLTASSYQVRGA